MVGRKAAADELSEGQYMVEGALHDIIMETMYEGDDPTPEQVREARAALNRTQRVLKQYIAPAAGCDPWGDPVPDIPHGRGRGCGVAPRIASSVPLLEAKITELLAAGFAVPLSEFLFPLCECVV